MRERESVCVCVCVCLSLSASVSLSVCVCACVRACACVCVCVRVCNRTCTYAVSARSQEMAKEIGTEAKRKVLNMGSYLVRRFLPRKLPRSSDSMRVGEERGRDY